jgi:hypothetical protein
MYIGIGINCCSSVRKYGIEIHTNRNRNIDPNLNFNIIFFNAHVPRCAKGFLQFADGDVTVPSSQAIQLCAENSRFSPPVVLFGDQGMATLLLR